MTTTLQRPSIPSFIEWLKSIPPKNFAMADWGKPDNCGTPHCLAGWADAYCTDRRIPRPDVASFISWFFDLEGPALDRLYLLRNSHGVSMSSFDAALTPERRKVLMLAFLDHFEHTREADWDRIIMGLMTPKERDRAMTPYHCD